ncbi:hypothetical protein NX059_009191 [Plenodomus lindquistii]|nr:hypothetical protein NX059_009191 [Plenodomus lindquistii]
MPPRRSPLVRFVHPSPRRLPQWTCPSCRSRTLPWAAPPPRPLHPISSFHSTRALPANSPPNHYETLQLTTTATAAEIKRQFYTLSKKHHPDTNQNDPAASTRFVAISEAYHVLSVPEKRAQYDATLSQSQASSSWQGQGTPGGPGYPQGSYSSASFGARPASGLNKKRSTFRGPPPSFYKAGGYGEFGDKRKEYAYQSSQSSGDEYKGAAGAESYGEYGGFGPGQQDQGNQVPHFDNRRHKETHDNIHKHIWARRRRMRTTVGREEEYARVHALANFLVVSGIVGIIGFTAKVFGDRHEARDNARIAKKERT